MSDCLVSRINMGSSLSKDSTHANGADTYYGINIPEEFKTIEDLGKTHVYTDKIEALKIFKKYKKARFKAFKSREEAMEFATQSVVEPPPSEAQENVVVGEKPSSYREPKYQDKVQFRKAIERGDLITVNKTIMENPRYLISVGDTPAILQEGSRYNALHVAARTGNADMCSLLLNTIGNPAYVGLLYGDDDPDIIEARANVLLDLYLNTPDKGLNETPLHFAVKYGALEATEVLVSYPQCIKNLKNKFRQTPKDIMCTRATESNASIKYELSVLLGDHYFVPVLRSPNNVVQPRVGEPFSPKTPLVLNNDVLQPELQIGAYAGPMNRETALRFRKKWKTPPRTSLRGSVLNSSQSLPVLNNYRILDTEKGLERVGRNLAHDFQVGWSEYWGFLNEFTDLSSLEGLQKLEEHLKARFLEATQKGHNHDTDMTPETSFNESDMISPMSDLCAAFKSFNLKDSFVKNVECNRKQEAKIIKMKKLVPIEEFNKEETTNKQNPVVYIDQGCQLFARRVYDDLLHSVTNNYENLSENYFFTLLKAEVKSLHTLVCSFLADSEFQTFNFQSLHSKVSMIITSKLRTLPQEDLESVISTLKDLKRRTCDIIASSDEDDGVNQDPSNRLQDVMSALKNFNSNIHAQTICIARFIIKYLETEAADGPTEGCSGVPPFIEEKCLCSWEVGEFIRNNRRTSSLKRKKTVQFTNVRSDVSSNAAGDMCEESNDTGSKVNPEVSSDNSATYGTDEDEDNLSSESGEGFHSAHSSLSQSRESVLSSDNDGMESADEEGVSAFIEGDKPTRIDASVLHALTHCNIDADEFPFIYRWRHQVLLHSEKERESWPSPKTNHLRRPLIPQSSSPYRMGSPVSSRRPSFGSPIPPARRLGLVD